MEHCRVNEFMGLHADALGQLVVAIAELDVCALRALVAFSLVNRAAFRAVSSVFEPLVTSKSNTMLYDSSGIEWTTVSSIRPFTSQLAELLDTRPHSAPMSYFAVFRMSEYWITLKIHGSHVSFTFPFGPLGRCISVIHGGFTSARTVYDISAVRFVARLFPGLFTVKK